MDRPNVPVRRGSVERNLVGDEPFAVILADDVIDGETPATRQLIDVFARTKGPVLAVERMPRDQISNYGVIAVDASARSQIGVLTKAMRGGKGGSSASVR